MDPDVVLKETREAMRLADLTPDSLAGEAEELQHLREVRDGFLALDAWLSQGGFAPLAWQNFGQKKVCANTLPVVAERDLGDDEIAAIAGGTVEVPTGINVPTEWEMFHPETMAEEPDWDGRDHNAVLTDEVRKIAHRVGNDINNPTHLVEAVLTLFGNKTIPPEITDTEPRWNLEKWMVHVCQVMQWDASHVRETL